VAASAEGDDVVHVEFFRRKLFSTVKAEAIVEFALPPLAGPQSSSFFPFFFNMGFGGGDIHVGLRAKVYILFSRMKRGCRVHDLIKRNPDPVGSGSFNKDNF
jgi:hypothetical protein